MGNRELISQFIDWLAKEYRHATPLWDMPRSDTDKLIREFLVDAGLEVGVVILPVGAEFEADSAAPPLREVAGVPTEDIPVGPETTVCCPNCNVTLVYRNSPPDLCRCVRCDCEFQIPEQGGDDTLSTEREDK